MKKIAIYGDSFAQDFYGWPSILEEKLRFKHSDCKVVSYAVPGSSADYSYAKFLETHHEYDLIIFLWTQYTRSTLISVKEDLLKSNNISFNYHAGFLFVDTLKQSLRQTFSGHKGNRDIYDRMNKDLISWIKSEYRLTDSYHSKNMLRNIAMRDSVRYRRPDTINIEIFSELTNDNRFLFNVYRYGKDKIEKNYNREVEEDYNISINHFTKSQNIEFAQYLIEHIDGKINIHDTFIEPEKYYTISQTIEESIFKFK
jgi:hypothetical protein